MSRIYPPKHGREHGRGHSDPMDGPWYYATPIAPADTPTDLDYDSGSALNEAFDSGGGWGNIADQQPFSWRLRGDGDTQFRGAITGGEATLGSLVTTVPALFRQPEPQRFFVSVGSDASAVGVFLFDTDGTVTLEHVFSTGSAAASGDTLHTVSSSGASLAIDLATASVWDITLTANCTFTLASVTSGVACTLSLFLRQDGTGGRTVTWPGSVAWPAGSAPTLHSGANAVSLVTLTTLDGGTHWYGFAEPTDGSAGTITESNISLSDVTTDNVTSTKHGFAPKSPADATKFLNGDTTPGYAQVKDSDLSTSDITTNNASTSKHGFLKKLDNNSAHFMDGTGAWSTPAGSGSVASDTIWDAKGDLAGGTGADTAAKLTVGSDGTFLSADSTQTTGLKWVTGPAGTLLASFVQTGGTNQSTTSATQADVDATNAVVTFTAPASGNVLVRVTATCRMNATAQNGSLGLRESTTNIAGPSVVLEGNATVAVGAVLSVVFKITGISAGSHTYKLAYSASGGGQFTIRQIGSASTIYPVTMEVLAA